MFGLASSPSARAWPFPTGRKVSAALAPKQDTLEGLVYEKTKVINVPMIAEGSVQGYIVAQLVFTADAKVLRQLPVPPEAFVVDEAFRSIYGDQKTRFQESRPV